MTAFSSTVGPHVTGLRQEGAGLMCFDTASLRISNRPSVCKTDGSLTSGLNSRCAVCGQESRRSELGAVEKANTLTMCVKVEMSYKPSAEVALILIQLFNHIEQEGMLLLCQYLRALQSISKMLLCLVFTVDSTYK